MSALASMRERVSLRSESRLLKFAFCDSRCPPTSAPAPAGLSAAHEGQGLLLEPAHRMYTWRMRSERPVGPAWSASHATAYPAPLHLPTQERPPRSNLDPAASLKTTLRKTYGDVRVGRLSHTNAPAGTKNGAV